MNLSPAMTWLALAGIIAVFVVVIFVARAVLDFAVDWIEPRLRAYDRRVKRDVHEQVRRMRDAESNGDLYGWIEQETDNG
jgi:hypothetical protein